MHNAVYVHIMNFGRTLRVRAASPQSMRTHCARAHESTAHARVKCTAYGKSSAEADVKK